MRGLAPALAAGLLACAIAPAEEWPLATAPPLPVPTPAPEAAKPAYPLVGKFPVSPRLEQALQARATLIRPGIDTTRIKLSGYNPEIVVGEVVRLADAAAAGWLPGAVLFADSLAGDNMPIAVGWRITDPEKRDCEWSTIHELGDLTGPLVTTPLALMALQDGTLHLEDAVEDHVPGLAGSPVGRLRVDALLRHTSGLPPRVPVAARGGREEVLESLRAIVPEGMEGQRARPSGSNFLVLGLVLESILGEPVQVAAQRRLFEPAGMVNTTVVLPVGWRERVAPGAFSEWHGRLVWGEAEDPAAFALGTAAGNGGVTSTADDLGLFLGAMARAANAGIPDGLSQEMMRRSITPPEDSTMARSEVGLGWMLNGFGQGSFGWDAPDGSSFWMHPESGMYVVLLVNGSHPAPHKLRTVDKLRRHVIMSLGRNVPAPRPQASVPAREGDWPGQIPLREAPQTATCWGREERPAAVASRQASAISCDVRADVCFLSQCYLLGGLL